MDHCFSDMEFPEQTDPDVTDSASMLPFDFVDCTKHEMFMFYPELGYDLHAQLMNQRKRAEAEKYNSTSSLIPNDLQVPAHNLTMNNSKLKTKGKLPKSSKTPPTFDPSIFRPTDSSPASAIPSAPPAVDNGEKNRKVFYCRDCTKSFKFQTSLLRHNNKVHNCKYRCPTCHRVFSRQAYLDVHVSKPGSSCFSNYLGTARSRNIKT